MPKRVNEELDLVKLLKLTQVIRMLYGTQPAQLVFEKYLEDITGLTLHDLFARVAATSKCDKE